MENTSKNIKITIKIRNYENKNIVSRKINQKALPVDPIWKKKQSVKLSIHHEEI